MYWPFSSVVVVRVCWVLTLVAVTVAPGTAPPVLSLTLPRMVPVAVCAVDRCRRHQHECGGEGQEERQRPNGSVLLRVTLAPSDMETFASFEPSIHDRKPDH